MSAVDALGVINALNTPEGEDPDIVGVRLEGVRPDGSPLGGAGANVLKTGEDARVNLYTKDLRSPFTATGVFALYATLGFSTLDLTSLVYGEVQRLTFSTNATGAGTFTLSFQGQTTAPISFGANGQQAADNMVSALNGLSNVNDGDVLVIYTPFNDPQDPSNSNPFIWEFRWRGEKRRMDLPLMGVDTTNLDPAGQVTGMVEERFPGDDITNEGTFRSAFFTGVDYPNGLTAFLGNQGYEDVGAFDGNGIPNPTEDHLVVFFDIEATAAGTVDIDAGPASRQGSDILIFGSNDPVPVDRVDFGNTLTLIIEQPVNALDDTFSNGSSVPEDSIDFGLDLLGNDFLEDGSTGVLRLDPNGFSTPSAGGTVTANANNTMALYSPAPDFFGTETFTYTAVDGLGNSDTALVTIDVTPINDPPIAVDDFFTNGNSVLEDSQDNDLDVLANDDVGPANENETLTIIDVTQGSLGGNVTIRNDNLSVIFSPAADVNGTETFTYTVDDGNGLTDTATVTIDITPVNDPPTANDDLFTALEDSANNIFDPLANDSILPDEGETLILTSVDSPSSGGGTVLIVNNQVDYTPAPDFFGADTFTYTIEDDGGLSDTATVTVDVTNINDDPTANDDFFFVDEFSVDNVLLPLTNDSFLPDPTETLTITDVGTPDQGGTVDIAADGLSITYSPEPTMLGLFTETFTYTITDEGGLTDTATISIDVEPIIRPRARDDAEAVQEDSSSNPIDVLGNDLGNDGFDLSITSFTDPSSGSLSLNDNGTATTTDDFFEYTPDADFFGTDTFTYTIDDDFPNSDPSTATVTITVDNVNDPPVANDDAATYTEDSVNNIVNVLGNDSFLPDPAETLTVTDFSYSGGGSLTLNSNGTFTYSPAPDFFGTDTFTYTIEDSGSLTDDATVTLTIDNVNDDPMATDDSFTVNEDTINNSFDVLGNDSFDPDPFENLTITSVTTPSNGSVSLVSGSSITYTPDDDFFGSDTFTYTISDGLGGSDSATVSIDILNVNDDPTANHDTALVLKNFDDQAVDVLANDTFLPDPFETLTIVSNTDPDHGSVTIVSGSSFTYTPDTDYEGPDSFTYTISDGNGGFDSATVDLNVVEAVPTNLSGFTYFDTNRNGMRDAHERMIGGLTVTLSGKNLRGIDVHETTTTNAQGEFNFVTLPDFINDGDGYTIHAEQPMFTDDGQESKPGNAPGVPNSHTDTFNDIELSLFGSPEAKDYGFAEQGVKPEFITLEEILASSSSNGLIAATNAAGDQFWYSIFDNWNVTGAEMRLSSDMQNVEIKVWDVNNQQHTRNVPLANPHVRIMGNDRNGGYVLRVDGLPQDVGFNLSQNGGGGEGEGEAAPVDESGHPVMPEAEMLEMIAAADRCRAVDAVFDGWS